ncbi:hypothetical protein V6N13_099274 [Hibiscus sabdariffa]
MIVKGKKALEVCKSLGLHFKANDAEVEISIPYGYLRKKVGAEVNLRALEDFNDFIESLEMVDLPLHEGRFIWSNLREASIVLSSGSFSYVH